MGFLFWRFILTGNIALNRTKLKLTHPAIEERDQQ